MALLSIAVLSSFITMERRNEKKTLETLWSEYQKASEQDRVRKMAEILVEIKEGALSERAAWDYYRSSLEYVNVMSRRNWKLRDSLRSQMRDDIASYDEPLLIYLMDERDLSREELFDSALDMKERLRDRNNDEVYKARGMVLNDAVRPLIKNDYEYVLWDMFRSVIYQSSNAGLKKDIYDLLREEVGDVYPKAGIAEYFYVMYIAPEADRKARLESLAGRYEGRALSLLPCSALIEMEFNENRNAGTSDYFVDLKKRLESYEHERKSYRSGSDKLIAGGCNGFRQLLDHLDTKSARVMIQDGKAHFALRNLGKVRVKVSRGNVNVYETVLDNPVESFYAPDTLTVGLPALDDGDYRVRCYDGNDEIGWCNYPKYTLSVATRTDKDGVGVYVADYQTGEPLGKVDMALYKGDRKVAEASGVEFDGFTPLPRNLASRIDKDSGYYLVCSCAGADGTMRRSQDKYISMNRDFSKKYYSSMKAAVMLDRSAFNPGETVKFKAVVYDSSSEGGMKVAQKGETVTVYLRDSRGDKLLKMDLQTNEFGSVAGEFVLDGIRRNGYHSIEVRYGTRLLGSANLTVDEFVLPTFDLTFDEPDKTFLPGDTVVVSGKLLSYTGHSLASADVTAKVTLGHKLVTAQKLDIAADGRFSLSFADVSDESFYSYEVEVKVADLTGETKSFYYRQNVMRRPIVNAVLENPAEGSFRISSDGRIRGTLLSDETARVALTASYSYGTACHGLPLSYELIRKGETLLRGEALSGEVVEVGFAGLESGLYQFVVKMSLTGPDGGKIEGKTELQIVKVRDADVSLDDDFENVFRVVTEEAPELQIGAGRGPVWAVVELYGDMGQRLKSDVLYLEKGEMKTVRYDYKPEYPGALVLNVLYFRESDCHTYTHNWKRPSRDGVLPLKFVRFEDMTAPGTSCSITLEARPEAEILVSVFDVATEQVRPNRWARAIGAEPPVSYVWMDGVPGMDGHGPDMMDMGVVLDEDIVVGYGVARRSKAARNYVVVAESETESEAIPFQLADVNPVADIVIRDDFSTSLAFEPFLRPADDGTVGLDFVTSDKVSTFVVSVFAHDKDMNNNVLRREMLVTLPVKVSVVQPQYLYEGDRYVLHASVSNSSSEDVSGVVVLEGAVCGSCEVTVPAGGSVPVSFDVAVPSGMDKMDFKIAFLGDMYKDGVLVSVPVYPAAQELKEAHSAVLLSGMSEEEVLNALRERFVNVSPTGAEYSSISVMDVLREALPLTAEAKGRDVISQSEAMYVNLLAAGLRAAEGEPVREYVVASMAAASKILLCANGDGGFGWFEGLKSSPVVTAVVLERYAGLRDRGLLNVVSEVLGEDALEDFSEAMVKAVGYLDSVYFSDPDRPEWYGRISLWQYLNVRSMYAGMPFDMAAARKAVGAKEYNEFKKAVKSYLMPKKGERWSDGAVLSKVRMIRIINALEGSVQGSVLADAWGVSSGRKLHKSMKTELESLKEYAVVHPSGGIYYPNAVLPFRGLLESEVYAHSMICDLYKEMAGDEKLGDGLAALADGIRLWIMLQKETQQWDSDPGFVEAMASVYDASDSVKDTRVIVLSKRYLKPFDQIRAAGNGFKVSVDYYLEKASEGEKVRMVPVSEGDTLHVGDKVIAKYSVWSEENRSYVRLSVPRPACLRPENQLSGWSGGWLRPLSYGFVSVSPYAYREVKTDRTLYWIDVFPEEESTIEEVLFVTQEGSFTSPVTEIESLYAPHYRANSSFFRFR